MKLIAPSALALLLGACAHECNCAAPAPAAEIMEEIELDAPEPVIEEAVVEEVVIEEAAPIVQEEEVIVEVQVAPAAAAEITEDGTSRRVVTRRLVDNFEDAGTPTAPAMDGSAIDDPLLSEKPRVLEDTTFGTSSVPDETDGEREGGG